jgi:hypothetical protein
MANKVTKVSAKQLKALILKESEDAGFPGLQPLSKVPNKTKEVDADELADTLEKQIDMLAALKIREAKLTGRLKKIREVKRRIHKRIAEGRSK